MTAALRVLEGHVRTYRRTWKGSAVSSFANPALFLLAMGVGLGSLVDRGQGATLPGSDYLAFLAPGLLAATAMQAGTMDSVWPVRGGYKWQRTYHAALATPITPRDLVYGHLFLVALRQVLIASAFVLVMTLFGAASPAPGVLAILPAVLTGLAFAPLVAAYTISRDNEFALSSLFRFGTVPMFLFSGTFFPVDQLPDVLQPVALATPLWHGVELCRAAALGLDPHWPALLHVGYLAAWLVGGTVVAVRVYTKRLVT